MSAVTSSSVTLKTPTTPCDHMWGATRGDGVEMCVRCHSPKPEAVTPPAPESILAEAIRITGGDRQQSYGSPKPNHDLIAAGWSILLRTKVTAEDVCRCMVWSKLARDMHSPKRDNVVDIAGYAWVLDQSRETPTIATPEAGC